MTIVPRYDLPNGTELTAQARTLVVGRKTDAGYEVSDQGTGKTEFLPYVLLARMLKQPGLSLKKPRNEMSIKASLRLGTYQTVEALSARQQEDGAFALAICFAIANLHKTICLETSNPDYQLSQRKLNDPELRDRIAEIAGQNFGKKIYTISPAGGNRVIWQLPRGRTLNQMYRTYLSCLPMATDGDPADPLEALIPLGHLKGNRRSRITWLIRDLMSEAIDFFAKEPKSNSIANIHVRITTQINALNKQRLANQLPPLHVPSQTTLSLHQAERYSPTEALIRDLGERAGKNKRGRGSTDVRALMIGEYAEADEVRLSLIVTAKVCGLWEKLSDPDKRALKNADDFIQTRLVLLVLLDVATRMPLAWVISDEPRAQATLALLRMATRDKTREKIRYGCTGMVAEAVGLGMIKTDNGTGLRNAEVKSAILGCGGVSLDVRTYSPTDKPFVERHFGTLESILLKILHGYTGRRAGELPGYDAAKNGVLDVDLLYEILSCFYIDELPSMRHYGFGMWGRRPAEVYQEIDSTRGIFTPLDPDIRRIHLCWEEKVTPSDEGVRVFSGIWFNSDELQTAIDDPKAYGKSKQRQVSVFVDPDNLNEATVVLPRTPKPIKVRLQTSVFADMTLNEVLNLIMEYRKEDPTKTEMYEDRLANVRRNRQHILDRIGVEKGLSRSYHTREEIKSKARAAFRGARVVSSQGIPNTVSAGQITADRPEGKVFDFSRGAGFVDATAVEPIDSQPLAITANTDADMTKDASDNMNMTASRKKLLSTNAPKNPTPPPESPREVFGRPTNFKRLE
jgi:putative transposase